MTPILPFGVSDPVARNAAAWPKARACIELASGKKITYAQLDTRVDLTAGWLSAELGDPIGKRVAWLGRNSLDQVTMIFGCWRAGAVIQPLNWRLSAPEAAVLVADAEPSILFYEPEFEDAALAAAAAAPGVRLLRLSPELGGLEAYIDGAKTCRPAQVADDAPCILLYTSGSTGRPKGVIITRAGAAWSTYNFIGVGKVSARSAFLCDAPMFHTVGLMAVTFSALTAGGCVVISDRFLPDQTLKRISDPALGVTHYFAVPQIAQMLREHPDYPASDLSGLTAMFTGGAPMPPALIEAYLDDGVLIANGFGMSEAGTVMCMPLDEKVVRSKLTSCGVLARAVEARVVGADGRALPHGEAGELWLRGPAVTPGYWRQPEATAAAFEGEWFRTGDIATVDDEGFFQLIDRLKDMYISGGENVYPAEIETLLAAAPGVAEVAVVAYPDPRWGESGCAFIVAAEGCDLDAAAVLGLCEGKLARYKHPRQVRFAAALPRTASGKVKKDELRKALAGGA